MPLTANRPVGAVPRAVAVLVLLLGVLAMHGVTAGHAAGMATMPSAGHGASAPDAALVADVPMLGAAASGHDLAGACVAVLTGSLLLALLWLSRRSLTRRGVDDAAASALTVLRIRGSPPRYLSPSPWTLQVLRT